MRLVIQRVKEARVVVKESGEEVAKIEKGLFVLVGVGQEDKQEYADLLAEKVAKLRVMADKEGKMNLAVGDVEGEILVVSQFTLYADISGGNRPSFIKAGDPQLARNLYERFVGKLKALGITVQTGRFGQYMEVSLINDGPVTIIIEHPS